MTVFGARFPEHSWRRRSLLLTIVSLEKSRSQHPSKGLV